MIRVTGSGFRRYATVDVVWMARGWKCLFRGVDGLAVGVKEGLLSRSVSKDLTTSVLFRCIYLPLLPLRRGFDSIAALDNIGFETDRSGGAVQLEEQATGIAEYRTELIPAPKGCCRGTTILAHRL